jgi:hypothetical protein
MNAFIGRACRPFMVHQFQEQVDERCVGTQQVDDVYPALFGLLMKRAWLIN